MEGTIAYLYGALLLFTTCGLSLALISAHMRYIDRVQYAKNDLLRDQQILQRYREYLQRKEQKLDSEDRSEGSSI